MLAWALNDLFLLSSVLLLVLGSLLISSRRTHLTWQFFVATAGLSGWNFCLFALNESWGQPYVSAISRVQLAALLVFAYGLYLFASSFPHYRNSPWHKVSLIAALGLMAMLLFTRVVTDAEIKDGVITYQDGPGFIGYVIFIAWMAAMVLFHFLLAWRQFPELRSKTRYFIAGVMLFMLFGITCNLLLPLVENYSFLNVGRFSGTLMALLFFYAIVKHEFLDITVIINRHVAWLVTLVIMVMSAFLAWQKFGLDPRWAPVVIAGISVGSALIARPLQQFLLTSAKRKFIKTWYEPEKLFLKLGELLAQENSREKIFRVVAETLDSVFEIEQMRVLVAERDAQGLLESYRVLGSFARIEKDSAFILQCQDRHTVGALSELNAAGVFEVKAIFPEINTRSLLIPFHSPEFMEGILLLGNKSSGADYSNADLTFFNSLINYVAPLLYRLTPIETLEKIYDQHQRRQHQEELQLVRAQKIEAIVHATRQCHHEIRTPLNIIKLGLSRVKTLEDLESYKNIAREEINHAIEIVDETLTITDMNSSDAKPKAEIRINDVLNRCVRLVDKNRFNLTLDLQEVSLVRANASDLQVAITNLIHNAMEAMPEGGSLHLASKQVDQNVQISVEDTGHGIPAEIRARVWEPYFSGKGDGVGNSNAARGWGLTIVNRIVTEHRGTIQLSSEVGVGTRFTISLPAVNSGNA